MSFSTLSRITLPLAVAAAVAIAAIALSFGFRTVPAILAQGLQPAAFPRLVAGLILILCVVALVADLRAPPEPGPALPRVFGLTVLLVAVFGAVVAFGDFLLALMIATGGLCALWGERRWWVVALVGLVAPTLVLLFFDLAFQVRFPRGILLDLYYG